MIQAGALSMQDEGTSDRMAVARFAPNGRVAISSTVFVSLFFENSVSILLNGKESYLIPL